MPPARAPELADDHVLEVDRLVVDGGPGLDAQLGGLAVGEDDPEPLDVVGRRPVAERRAGRPRRRRSSRRRAGLRADRVGAEPPAERGELARSGRRARPPAGRPRSRADRDDPAEVAAEVDDQPRPERPARPARSPPRAHGSGSRSRPRSGRPSPRRRCGPGDDHAERVDLVEAGVVRSTAHARSARTAVRRRARPRKSS